MCCINIAITISPSPCQPPPSLLRGCRFWGDKHLFFSFHSPSASPAVGADTADFSCFRCLVSSIRSRHRAGANYVCSNLPVVDLIFAGLYRRRAARDGRDGFLDGLFAARYICEKILLPQIAPGTSRSRRSSAYVLLVAGRLPAS